MSDTIKFLCPECRKKIRVPAKFGGKRGACPACKKTVTIPEASTLPDAAQEEASESKRAAAASGSARTAVPAEPPTEEMPVAEEIVEDAPAKAPASGAFLKFNCPNCGKTMGFPAKNAGSAQPCPICRVKIMVPSSPDEEAFIVGGAAARAPRGLEARSSVGNQAVPAEAPAAEKAIPVKMVAIGGVVAAALLVGLTIAFMGGKDEDATGKEKDVAAAGASNTLRPPVSPAQPAPPEPVVAQPPAARPVNAGAPHAVQPAVPPSAEPSAQPVPPADVKQQADPNDPFDQAGGAPEPEPAPPAAEPQPVAPAQPEPPAQPAVPGQEQEEELKLPEPQPKNEMAEGGQPAAPQNPQPPAQPEPPKPPAPVCAQCFGTGHVPILSHRPYFRVAGEPAPNPAITAPWIWCSRCNGQADKQEILKAEAARLANAENLTQMWAKTGLRFLYGETRHVSVHGEFDQTTLKKVLMTIDGLSRHLQAHTRSTLLTQSRPGSHQILIVRDVNSYNRLIDVFEKESPGEHWALARQSTGGMGRTLGYFNSDLRNTSTGPEHMATFQFAKMNIAEATDGKAPTWLNEGFAAYCENFATKMNLCFAFSYEKTDVKFGPDWNKEIKKYAAQGKLKEWQYIFPHSGIGMSALDYLTMFSMVSFLIQNDPKRFCDLVVKIRQEVPSEKALEEIYRMKIKDLQMNWARWAMSRP